MNKQTPEELIIETEERFTGTLLGKDLTYLLKWYKLSKGINNKIADSLLDELKARK